jgi:Zn-dependent protease with chaperone function
MVAFEVDSMWAVILVVSLVTLVLVLLLRKLIHHFGGVLSGVLLSLPLILPVVVALLVSKPGLPEVGLLQPMTRAMARDSGIGVPNLLLLGDSEHNSMSLYVLNGSPGALLVLVGALFSGVMLFRRLLGVVAMRRLRNRCCPLTEWQRPGVGAMVKGLADAAGLATCPSVLILPSGAQGAFAMGGRRGQILLSRDLLVRLDDDELAATLAHEIAHLESCDVRLVLVASLIRDLMAWNPLAHVAFSRLALDRELEADRRAACLTGRPLAVASSLVKMCELMRGHRRAAATSLGFWGGRGRIKRRVDRLLSVADARALPEARVRPLPFVVAGLLAVALALEVGLEMTKAAPSAVAVVWGAPHGYALPTLGSEKALRGSRPTGAPSGGGSALPPKNPGVWLGLKLSARQKPPAIIKTVYRNRGLSHQQSVRLLAEARQGWEAQRGWRASPLLAGPSLGPVDVYRIVPQKLMTRTVLGPQTANAVFLRD